MKDRSYIFKNYDTNKYYLVNKTLHPHELRDYDLDDDSNWAEKARLLQIRRWKKIRQHMA